MRGLRSRRGVPVSVLLAAVASAAPLAAQDEPHGPSLPVRAVTDLGEGVADLARDGWDVLTVPVRMEGDDWLTLAGVLGVGAGLYAADGEIQDAFRRNRDGRLHRAVRDVGEIFEPLGLMGNTNVIYLGGIAAGWLTGLDPLLHVSRDLVVSHWLASGTYQLPRRWIGRYRPEQGRGPRAFGNGTALPSGHSSTIVQVAAVLSHHLDRRPASLLLWGMAGTVLFQRIDSEKHWASDVWLGAAWGYGVARLVLRNADRRRGEEGRVSPSGGARPDPGEVRIRPFRTAAGGVGVAFRIAVHGSGPG